MIRAVCPTWSRAGSRTLRSTAALIALLLGMFDSTNAPCQEGAEPARQPPAANTASPARYASGECLIAAPACFENCPEKHVRTARGLCLPAAAPQGTAARGGVIVTSDTSAAHDEPATGAAHGAGEPSHQETDADAGSPDRSASSASTKLVLPGDAGTRAAPRVRYTQRLLAPLRCGLAVTLQREGSRSGARRARRSTSARYRFMPASRSKFGK